ncbi:glutaminyl-peptide cyclotransferase-like [Bacillus rossius redtenbacheri]|uniref:glutaminyl-peptide cyclotransferase-like n=1 Tax=Bacillus rossius redtenbacheri TaxID=93214 RepID=UPI002FDD972D
MLLIVLMFLHFLGSCEPQNSAFLRNERMKHKSRSFSDKDILKLASLSNVTHFDFVLSNILVPRVVGTPAHERVKDFIVGNLESLGWSVELDSFVDKVPVFGSLRFTNVVAKLNPNARRFVVLACHYDSKYFKDATFVGATDSAVPCAMLLNLAYVMKNQLDSVKNNDSLSLALVFFDGEEAFKHWSATDSIYGARHLAQTWEDTPYPAATRDGTNHLHRIDLFMLLDLLGAPDPKFYNYFPDTVNWYKTLIEIEDKLSEHRQFQRYSYGRPAQRYFQRKSKFGGIEDDHIPFLQRNVPVLHVITYPFPSVWHTPKDDRSIVDVATCENLNKILRVFVASYLHSRV